MRRKFGKHVKRNDVIVNIGVSFNQVKFEWGQWLIIIITVFIQYSRTHV
jgi:hypothetical protein